MVGFRFLYKMTLKTPNRGPGEREENDDLYKMAQPLKHAPGGSGVSAAPRKILYSIYKMALKRPIKGPKHWERAPL